ncbi:unnamed protein product [Lymnaea stagnalis]|uniref:NR LBD domain-containing protein n=1 Tax=Lymnaea stagnalis TaxID=6523 RepID=A0AAV2I9C1_LYMST
MGMSREAIKMGRPRKLYPSRQMDHAVSSTTQPQGMFPSYNNNYTRAHDSPLPATDRQNIATRDYCEQLTNTRESGLWMTREMKRPEFPVNSSSSSYVDTSYHRVTSQPARLPQSHNANLHVPMSRMGQFNDLDPISANQSSTMFNHSHPAREVLRNSAPGSSMPHQMLTLPPHQRVAPNPPNVPYNSLPPHRRGNNDSRSTESRHSLSLQAQHRFSHSTRNGLTVNNAVDNVALNHSTNHHRAYTAHPHRGPEVIPHPHLGPEVIPHPHFGLEVIPHLHHGPGARSEERQRMPKLVQMSRDMVSNKTLDQRVTPRGGHGDAWNTNKPLSSASYPPMPPPTGRGRQGLNRSRSPEMGSEEPRYESCEPSVLDLRISSKSRHKDIQPADSSDYIVNEILKSTSGFTSYNSLKRTHVTVEETKQQIYPFKITKLDNGSHSFPAHSIKRPCNTIGHHSSHLVPHGSSHDAACTSGRHAEMVIKSEITDDQSQPHTGTSTNDVAMLPQTTTFHQNTDHSKHNLSLLPSDRYNHANRPTSNCPNQQGPTSHCPNQQGPRTYCIYPCDPSDPSYISHQIITSFVPSSYTSTPATRKSTESSKYTSGLSAFAAGLSQPANGLGRSLIPVVSPPAKPSLQLDGARATVNHPNTEDVQASSSSGGSHGNQGDEPPREQQSSHDRFDPYTNEQTLVYINEMFLVVDTLTDTSLSSSQNLLKGKSTSELDAIDNMFTNIYGYSPLKVNHFWRSLFSYMPRGTTERWQGVLTSRQEEWLKDVTNNYANQVVACDEELNPPTVDTNKCELWPVRGEDTDHWKHFQERVARQTYAEAQFVLKLPDIEEIHPKDRVKLGNNTRLFGNTILMASKEWFDPVRKKFKFFWNWKLPQDHPLCPFRNRIIKTGSRIFNLHMDRTEVALLSALNIMSPENATFQNLPSIWDYTHTLMKILGHYLSTINVDPDDRIPELLSVMPKVRHMSMWYSNLIRNMRADPSSMDKTLQDLTKTAGKLSTTDCNVSTIGCKYSTTECKDLKSMTQSN